MEGGEWRKSGEQIKDDSHDVDDVRLSVCPSVPAQFRFRS